MPQNKPLEPQQVIELGKGSSLRNVFMAIVNLPAWGIAVLALSLFSIAAAVVYLGGQSRSRPMSGSFNILVVPLVEKHAWGYSSSNLGTTIASIIAADLQKSAEDQMVMFNPQIDGPQENQSGMWSAQESGLQLEAQKLSEKLNAQIVIYGVITKDKYGDSLVSVRFYISPINFGDAQELIGASLLGELEFGSFRLSGQTVRGTDLVAQNKELRDRIQVYTLIIKGLGAYLEQDFELANTYFEQALQPALWKNPTGLEVIYLLRGNLSIRQIREMLDSSNLDAAYQLAQQAENYFDQSLEASLSIGKGTYARAYLGLAGVESFYAIAKARLANDVNFIDPNALKKQEEYLTLALSADYQPETSDIPEKVAYSRAQIALAYYQLTQDEKYLESAQTNYQVVVNAFRNGNQRVSELSALSYSGLASIANLRKSPEEAVTHYLAGFELTSSPALKAQILVNIGRTYDVAGDTQNALQYYRDALERISDLRKVMPAHDIEMIRQRIETLQPGG